VTPWLFWPIWTLTLAVATPLWAYGEVGTLSGWPHAPIAWLTGFLLGIVIGITGARRLV
jgi:hypothetical protein